MKRLTWRDKNGVAYPCPWVLLPTLDETMGLLCDRLAAYEETGMEPEEIKKSENEDTDTEQGGRIIMFPSGGRTGEGRE